MAQKIQVKRGLQEAVSNLVLSPGEIAVALDTGNVYIGITSGNYWVNPPAASADTAKTLETAREFSLTGDVTTDIVGFNGSQNVTLTAALATITGLTAGTYPKVTVDKKGRVISGANLDASDIPNISKDKVTGLGTAATLNTGTSSGNVVVVGSDGKIPSSIIPSIAITDTFVVDSESAMLALTAQVGDVAVRSDLGKTYILKSSPATSIDNWQVILTPASPVTSVNSKTGNVVLTASDVGAESSLKNSTAKGSIADNDGFTMLDSASSNDTKKVLWNVIKSTLKTYFDTLYNKYTLPTMSSTTIGGAKVGSGLVISSDTLSVGDIDGGTF